MYPKTLALIDDDKEFSEYLAQYLRGLGVQVFVYEDSNEMLANVDAFAHEFFVIDLVLPGVNGIELIKILRKRTDAGVLVVSGLTGGDVFKEVLQAGADMHLVKPVQFEQVALAIMAVQRRAGVGPVPNLPWKLDRRAGELLAPDGARVTLSDIDRQLMECFLGAQGQTVTRETLAQSLGRTATDGMDGLNAIVYRLRRRIERATPVPVPLQSKSRVGYLFRAPLQAL
jgi:two-component system, OmpR family, response regulator